MINQGQSEFTLLAFSIRESDFEQDILQESSTRAEPGAGQHGDRKLAVILTRDGLTKGRLSGARATEDDDRSQRAVDATCGGLSRVFGRG